MFTFNLFISLYKVDVKLRWKLKHFNFQYLGYYPISHSTIGQKIENLLANYEFIYSWLPVSSTWRLFPNSPLKEMC